MSRRDRFSGRHFSGEYRSMKRVLIVAAVAGSLAAPAFAQMEVTCGDYSIMDNAQQMETIAALESETSQMASEPNLTADAIHERLAADCQGEVDMLVIDIVRGYSE
jgi:hypothetical protein